MAADRSDEVVRPTQQGRTATEDGAPTRSTATVCRRRRSSTALVAWVVPNITWLIRLVSIAGWATTAAIAPGLRS